ncbi:MAG TPA: TonB-dependent receptor [Blastocatellia bacterium]|nr:TonB-dependent receptor [Blastocatellia bacterium]
MPRFIFYCSLILCYFLPVTAQIQHGTVSGVVIDPTSAVVVNAVVKLEHPLNGNRYQTTTNARGEFAFNNVPLEQYVLRVEANGFAALSQPVAVRSNVPVTIEVKLKLLSATETVNITAQEGLVVPDSASTQVTIAEEFIKLNPRVNRNRGLQEITATAPGTATQSNGLLHFRGVDDGVMYVMDGVPIVDRLDPVSASPIDTDTINSMQIITGNIPAEFGGRNGSVVVVHPKSGIDVPLTGALQLGAADFNTRDLAASVGGKLKRNFGFYFNGATHASARFLDPVDLRNFNNDGGGVTLNLRSDWHATARDIVLFNVSANGSGFNAPNDEDQQEAGQRMKQRLRDNSQAISWQRVWSANTVTNLAYFHRTHESILRTNENAMPLFAEQDRQHTRNGFVASLSHTRGGHNFKTGFEMQRVSPREYFKFYVTDEEEAEEREVSDKAIAFDEDDPFIFRDRATRHQVSAYVQDAFSPAKNLSLQLGLRFDRSTLLMNDHQFSPRLGAVYFIPQSKTALRASFNRLYQPPQVDNLLLAASAQARELSPFEDDPSGGGAAIRPEKLSAYEVGFVQDVKGWFRLDASHWWRNFRNAGDPNVFFNTTIITPNSVNKGWSRGADVRLDVPERKGFSGYLSYTNMRLLQIGPINGGLFLTDEFIEIGPGTRFIPDQDQRNTGSFAINYQHQRSSLLLSFSGRHESGVPLEVDAERLEELKAEPGAELVNFERGRMKPRTIFNFTAGITLFRQERVNCAVQFDVQNLFDRAFAYNFGNPFEGTHFGPPRRWSGSLRFSFR